MKPKFLVIVALIFLTSACAPAPAELTASVEQAAAETQTAAPTKTPTLTPSPTHTPIPTQTVTPTSTPTREYTVMLEDDFSDPNSGWSVSEDELTSFAYENGFYSIMLFNKGYATWSTIGDSNEDVRVEVDIRNAELASAAETYGVICRVGSNNSDFYLAQLTELGNVQIWFHYNDDWENLIRRGTGFQVDQLEANHLAFECIGDELTLFVNGELAVQVHDSRLANGEVGFYIQSSSSRPAHVLFDNFRISHVSAGQVDLNELYTQVAGTLIAQGGASAAESAGPYGTEVPIQGANHVATGSDPGEYNSNPPTSGAHYAQWLEAGFYEGADLAGMGAFPHAHAVHNLEHGYIIFWYNCDLLDEPGCQDLKAQIRSYLDQSPVTKLIAFPWHASEVPLVLTSWGYLLELPEFDTGEADRFINANRFLAPEPNAP